MDNEPQAEIVGVHLVGSVPVETPEELFALAGEKLGNHLSRLGDGEVGERKNWLNFQNQRLAQSPQLTRWSPTLLHKVMAFLTNLPRPPGTLDIWRVKPGVAKDAKIELPPLGYAEAALSSYEKFRAAKDAGRIPQPVRFMVGLPTPLNVVTIYFHRPFRAQVAPFYQAALLEELGQILEGIPHEDLSIQWESVLEIMMLERHPLAKHYRNDVEGDIHRHLREISAAVPEDVELGFHLCYGDAGHKHLIEPKDTAVLCKLANWICADAGRSVDFLHMPVPKERDDDAYFEPLKDLALQEGTKLYLGLIHRTGGEDGNKARAATASRHVPTFGVAAECGFGRRNLATIPALMDLHTAIAAPVRG